MDDYNASDTRDIRRMAKAAKLADRARLEVVLTIMSSPGGRDWMWDILNRCHVFSSSFSSDQLILAFNEGERNVGLTLLADIMRAAPDQYIQMTREANDRRIAADRGSERGESNSRGRDSGRPDDADGSALSDYASGDELFGQDPAHGDGADR